MNARKEPPRYTLPRLVLAFFCVEALAMFRAYPGFQYALTLAVLFVIKHQALAYLPASYGYMQWHEFVAVVLGFNLVGRFFSAKMAFRCASVPSHYPGRFLLWPKHWRTKYLLYYVEPALLLFFILFYRVPAPPYSLRFVPMFRWDMLPLPYGIEQPYPVWYRQYAVDIAALLPFLTVPALLLHNRLQYADSEEGRREARAKRRPVPTKQAPVFTPVTLPGKVAR